MKKLVRRLRANGSLTLQYIIQNFEHLGHPTFGDVLDAVEHVAGSIEVIDAKSPCDRVSIIVGQRVV
jgi:hypothetical protein